MNADTEYDWKQTATDHFVFIYQEKDKAAVGELVGFCEEVYKQVTTYFDSYPEQILCVVYGNTDLANGYYSFPPHHIGLFVAAPISPWVGSRHESWLKLLLIHELTHYVHLKSEKGFLASLSCVFGDAIKGGNAFFLPGWMLEGITTNTETMFSKGGRGRNPFFEIYYKAPLLENHFFSLDQAEYSSAYPPPGRIYVAGLIFVRFLMEKFGTDVFRRINDEYVKWPLFGPWHAVRKVTGYDAVELFTQMKEELSAEYKQDRLLPQGELVTPEEIADYALPVITDQGWFMYRSSPFRHAAVIKYDPESKQETVLFETMLADDYSLTADKKGDTIVFAGLDFQSNPRLIDSEVLSDLYVYHTATGELNRLTHGAHLYHPALSADGTHLIAVQRTGSYSRLVEVDLVTGDIALLFAEQHSSVYNPVFSPDRKKIAFVLHRHGLQDIYLLEYPLPGMPLNADDPPASYNADKKQIVIGPDTAGDYYPRFIDDNTLLFSSDRGGSLALYTLSLAARDLFLVCEEPVAAFAGYKLEEDIIYASYSWRGFCIKKMAQHALIYKRIALPPAVPYPPAPGQEVVSGEDYVDWPLFQFWLPFPDGTVLSPNEVVWGGGVYLLGVSPLQTTMYSVTLSFFPQTMQPAATLEFQTALGLVDILYALDLSYEYTSGDYYRQSIDNTVLLSVPLFSNLTHSVRQSMYLYGGLHYGYNLYAWNNFSFLNGFEPAALDQENELNFISGVNFSVIKNGGIIDYYAPLAFTAAVFIQVPLPVFPESEQGFHTVTNLSVNLPLFLPHTVLKLGCKASYTTEELLGYPVIRARGMFDSEEQAAAGRALFSADILSALALLDQPVAGGVHLDGIGLGFHVEVLADYQLEEIFMTFDKQMFLGCELSLIVGLGTVSIPVGAGVSFRVDPADFGSFDANQDIRPYFFFGFNSLLNALTTDDR
ncbi:MAG: PD40 domain-containing protein [Spirochaetales bacterium]|nr:PD40 domain-containing protein [Spirochaetales bacterium]